jgi:hypothetical protein
MTQTPHPTEHEKSKLQTMSSKKAIPKKGKLVETSASPSPSASANTTGRIKVTESVPGSKASEKAEVQKSDASLSPAISSYKDKDVVDSGTPVRALTKTETEDLSGIPTVLKWGILGLICLLAFSIRLFAVVRYESVIHEFDPYFNFRTTKYLAHEGFLEFLNWFDDRGWYPLGRTIGGTIYPGLMLR